MSVGVARNLVFWIFCFIYLLGIIGPVQLAIEQLLQIVSILPQLTLDISSNLENWTPPLFLQKYQPYISNILVSSPQFIDTLTQKIGENAQNAVQTALGAFLSITGAAVYLILLPLLVFFMLKDKAMLYGAIRLIPGNFELVKSIWNDMEEGMARYVSSKLWEVMIVGLVTWGIFYLLKFEYAALMGIFTGLSVLVPYVGAFVVTIPVFLLGLSQWGFSVDLSYLMIAYFAIQFLDGNVLSTLMFSDAVKIPPTAILISVIVFGRLWGFWGAVFAIPLVSLLRSLAHAWIKFKDSSDQPNAS